MRLIKTKREINRINGIIGFEINWYVHGAPVDYSIGEVKINSIGSINGLSAINRIVHFAVECVE